MNVRKDFVKAEIDDDSVMLVPTGESGSGSGCMIELNETAALIYDSIVKGLDAGEIAAGLAAEYGISPEKAAKDVEKVIVALTEAGVLE